jgi:hypothetical protein
VRRRRKNSSTTQARNEFGLFIQHESAKYRKIVEVTGVKLK